jgi:hypothetical protein
MKTFIIALLFILATIFPILFFPLLALTLVTLLVIAPYVMKHGVWGDNHGLKAH